ncbi:hypothetical protein [Cupriavidus campinensis]|uniref:Uncharacterized protein n=1 Tax=Cupriavidus campinensis TaxID=151783 RepID=A0ABY3ESW4_9BURK|nr:hypothetical protein [Cupriavidus campinensis]TSP14046.1 hypothetical protein FGG12_06135 [Cupriavidus campinensis]
MITYELVLTYKRSGWKRVVRIPAANRHEALVELPKKVSLKNVDIIAFAVHWEEGGGEIHQP